MLRTVADKPKHPYDLWVCVNDFSPVDSWLCPSDGSPSLDGVYLQFQKEMLEPADAAALKKLSERRSVGVWTQSGRDPDDYSTFRYLVQER
jgi:hypothetical protein